MSSKKVNLKEEFLDKFGTRTDQYLLSIYDFFEPHLKKSPTKIKKGVLTPEQEAELPAKIQEYNLIFPEKTKIPTSGKFARCSNRELLDAFVWFLINNPQYPWDIILRATKIYVHEFEQKKWEYMRTSQYFVRKQTSDKKWISDLANYCQQVVDGLEVRDEHVSTFTQKVV